MALLYDKSSGAKKEGLVESLLATFSIGQRKVEGDTTVVLDDEKGEYSTYKELCAVAQEMDQPELIYNFLDLAAHHSIWSSKLGAVFSLSSMLQANKKLSKSLVKILPKLYRYQFDSNTKIQMSMKQLWLSLVSNARETINTHFDAIISDLLLSMAVRQYRERAAACAGLVELLHGRNMAQLSPYLEKLWAYTFKLLDDVNEKVRQSAIALAQQLSHLSLRLCDAQYSNRTEASHALSIILPVLLKEGVTSRAAEIQSVSIKALLGLVKIGGTGLVPHLPSLIVTLLESMSNLEPQAFAYLQFHAQSLNMTQEQLEQARTSIASSGPLYEALMSCLTIMDLSALASTCQQLTELLRTGVGLPSLTAAARFVVSLATGPLGPQMQDLAPSLMTVLQNGLTDRSVTLRKIYAEALGALCKIAKKKKAGKIITNLLSLYTSPDTVSNAGIEQSRLVSAFAIRSIVRQGGDYVRTNFLLDIVAVAFVGTHDTVKEIATLWGESFEELAPGLDSNVSLYLSEITTLVSSLVQTSSYALRHIALLALKHAVLASKTHFAPHINSLLPLLLSLLPGRLWSGKEVTFDVLLHLVLECRSATTRQQQSTLLHAMLPECQRPKLGYAGNAIRCVGRMSAALPHLPIVAELRPILQPIIEQSAGEEKKNSMTDVGEEEDSGTAVLLQTYAYGCFGDLMPNPQVAVTQVYESCVLFPPPSDAPHSSSAIDFHDWYVAQQTHAGWLLDSLLSGLEKGWSWIVRAAILVAVKRWCEAVYAGELVATTIVAVTPPCTYTFQGASVATAPLFTRLLTSLSSPLCLGDAKYPAIRARSMEVLSCIVERQAVVIALAAPVNYNALKSLLSFLSTLRGDSDPTVLRLLTGVQSKLQNALAATEAQDMDTK